MRLFAELEELLLRATNLTCLYLLPASLGALRRLRHLGISGMDLLHGSEESTAALAGLTALEVAAGGGRWQLGWLPQGLAHVAASKAAASLS
jgi:hypothetical protein